MKQKELKNLAMRIAALEKKLSNTENKSDVKKYQNEIINLSNKVEDIEDLFKLDILIQQFLEK